MEEKKIAWWLLSLKNKWIDAQSNKLASSNWPEKVQNNLERINEESIDTPLEKLLHLVEYFNLKIGDSGERIQRLNHILRRWDLVPAGNMRLYSDATAVAMQNLERYAALEISYLHPDLRLIQIERHLNQLARLPFDELDLLELARIAQGQWSSVPSVSKFDRFSFTPSRAVGNELLIAPREGSAEKTHLDKPWDRRSIMTDNPAVYAGHQNPLLVVRRALRSTALLAQHARARHHGNCVAVTGSSGKTSTKELIAQALGEQWLTAKTGGTSNTLYSSANVLLNAPVNTELLVFECGLGIGGSMLGDQSNTIRPHIAVITSVSAAHLGGYASVHEIAMKKLEMANALEPMGHVIVDGDCEWTDQALAASAQLKDKSIVRVGLTGKSQVRVLDADVSDRGTAFTIDLFGRRVSAELPLFGVHWAKMGAMTLACCQLLGGDVARAARALSSVDFVHKGRGELINIPTRSGAIRIFDSHFNANPGSMEADLRSYESLSQRFQLSDSELFRTAIIGAYGELGDANSPAEHKKLIERLAHSEFETLLLIGSEEFSDAPEFLLSHGKQCKVYASTEAVLDDLAGILSRNSFLFIKGSHKWNLAAVTPFIRAHFDAAT
jgi:UDP-N-acetylmuramoyl-tripeptide--D-alanyl-D-alanine ligase